MPETEPPAKRGIIICAPGALIFSFLLDFSRALYYNQLDVNYYKRAYRRTALEYLVLSAAVLCLTGVNVFAAFYNRCPGDGKGASSLYNLLYTLAAFLCWGALYAARFSFAPGVLWYSVGFGACYAVAQISVIQAMRCGSVSLTTLMLQLSLIATAIWGFIFWGEKPTALTYAGLALVAVALVLCIYQRNEQGAVNPRWLLFSVLAFAGNAGCTIIQKQQVRAYNGQHAEMLMLFALLIAFLTCLIVFIVDRPPHPVAILRKRGFFPVASGMANVGVNLAMIFLATRLSGSVVYPTVAVGALSITALFSAFVFKERLTLNQWIGMGTGAVAVLLLSL